MVNTKLIKLAAIAIALILVISIIFVEFVPKHGEQTQKPMVKIGVLVPLTGSFAYIGKGIENALLLEQSQLPVTTKYDYQLIFKDSQFSPTVSSTATQELINVDNVSAIISFGSSVGETVAPLAEQSNVIHFAIASDTSIANRSYNFVDWVLPSEEAKVWVDAASARNITRIAVLGVNGEGETVIINAVQNATKGTNVNIVSEQLFDSSETDFRTMILKAQQENPQIYLLLVPSTQLETLASQMIELGINTSMSSIENFELVDNPSMFNGMWYVNAANWAPSLQSQYEAKYSSAPSLGSGNAYDSFDILVKAFESAGANSSSKPSNEAVLEQLHNMGNFTGLFGSENVSKENIVSIKAIVKEVVNGTFVQLNN